MYSDNQSYTVDMFQFGSILGHSEQNQGTSGARTWGQCQVPCSTNDHIPLHVTTRCKLADSKTGGAVRHVLHGNSMYHAISSIPYLKAASFCSNWARSKVLPYRGEIMCKVVIIHRRLAEEGVWGTVSQEVSLPVVMAIISDWGGD